MMKSREIVGRKKSAYYYTAVAAGSVVALATSYAAYESYRRDVHGKSARCMKRVWKSAQQYLEAFSIGGEICRRVARDVESYLLGQEEEDVEGRAGKGEVGGDDSTVTDGGDDGKSVSTTAKGDETRNAGAVVTQDGVPRSLQRLARLVQSEEFCETVASTVGAVCTGVGRVQIAQGDAEMMMGDGGRKKGQSGGALGQVLEALLSERGQSLVSVAVSMGARSMVSAYVETQKKVQEPIGKGGGEAGQEESNTSCRDGDAVMEFLSKPGGQRLAVMCISACANSAMKAYMQETIDINYYDQMLSSISKPKHLDVVKECIALFVKVAVTSFKNGDSGAGRQGSHEADFEIDDEVLIEEKDTTAEMLQHDTAINSPCSAVVSHEDEVDSDYMMQYSSRSRSTREAKEKITGSYALHRRTKEGTAVPQSGQGHYGLVSAIGREWIAVSQDPESRSAIASVVGCATREAVGAVADTIADRLQWTSFVVVLLFGILSAMCLQLLLRVVGLA